MDEVEQTLEADPSTASETSDASVSEQEPAESSAAEGESEESLLSVVQSAVRQEIGDPEDTGSDPPADQTEEVVSADEGDSGYETPEAETDVPADGEAYTDVPFHTHPRFKQLIEERNRYRTDSDQYQKVQDFMSSNNLSEQDAAEAFRVAAMMKNNPSEAYEIVKSHLDALAQATGQVLPEDIQTKLNEGYMDEDAAKELSRSRAEVQRERYLREQQQTQYRDQAAKAQFNMLTNTINDWEENTRQSDPDYSLKRDEIDDRVRVLISQEGRPSTPEAALRLANTAYDQVNERFKQRQPEKQPIKPVSGGKLGGTPTPEPKSLHDVINMTLRG